MFSKLFKKKKNKNEAKSAKKNDNSINDFLDYNQRIEKRTINILLLGPGGSGKSTIIKQMHKIYDGSIPTQTLRETAQFIKQKNILQDISNLILENLNLRGTDAECKLQDPQSESILQELHSMFQQNKNSFSNIDLDRELATNISQLWKDPGMQATFDIKKKAYIMDSTPYYFANIFRIADDNYVATFEDYIRVRNCTVGVCETHFDIIMDRNITKSKKNRNSNSQDDEKNYVTKTKPAKLQNSDIEKLWRFKFTDVGGQRVERRKWMKCFAGMDTVIYIMSLAGYDQVLFEDNTKNCLTEAFDVFEKTFLTPSLRNVDLILFLNKNDLFGAKIKAIPFTCYDSDFPVADANDALKVINYVKDKFRERYIKVNKNKDRTIHFHVTSATDTSQIATVMSVIQLQQIRKNIKSALLV